MDTMNVMVCVIPRIGDKMKKTPKIYYLNDLKEIDDNSVFIENEWVPARSLGLPSIKNRLHYAWLVFSGKADVLVWPKGQ